MRKIEININQTNYNIPLWNDDPINIHEKANPDSCLWEIFWNELIIIIILIKIPPSHFSPIDII